MDTSSRSPVRCKIRLSRRLAAMTLPRFWKGLKAGIGCGYETGRLLRRGAYVSGIARSMVRGIDRDDIVEAGLTTAKQRVRETRGSDRSGKRERAGRRGSSEDLVVLHADVIRRSRPRDGDLSRVRARYGRDICWCRRWCRVGLHDFACCATAGRESRGAIVGGSDGVRAGRKSGARDRRFTGAERNVRSKRRRAYLKGD